MSQSGTKERIVEAGKRVIFRKGFHRTRVSDITSEAGLSHGTFYIYFPSKEGFLLELLLSVRDKVLSFFEEGKRAVSEGDLERGKELFFIRSFDLMLKEKGLAKVLFFEALCSDHKFLEFYKESKELFLKETKEVLELLKVEKPELKAHLLVGTARHLVELSIITGKEVKGLWLELLEELGIYS